MVVVLVGIFGGIVAYAGLEYAMKIVTRPQISSLKKAVWG